LVQTVGAYRHGQNVMKAALITGITGQDGAYLARFLLGHGYKVHGTSRKPTGEKLARLKGLGILDRVEIHAVDPADFDKVREVLHSVRPPEIYHLAGQSSVAFSFRQPRDTVLSNLQGTVNILETIRLNLPEARFYHSSSSEMFGGDLERPYTEQDLFHPRSPYAVSKAASHWIAINYRESYRVYACSGVMFNHESPLRSESFVTRKITSTVARIKSGSPEELRLGDLSIRRDWGYAPEYAEAMWLMLQREKPDDYIVSTGQTHSLQEFVETAFAVAGLDWRKHTIADPAISRPNEVRFSVGDPAKAGRELGWKARTSFKELVELMVQHDLSLVDKRKRSA
jgi:GDPmannose 4,6-dehydratase